jgi:hypothetical protein
LLVSAITPRLRRKDAYEALHPETKHGSPSVSRQVGDTRERSGIDRFTSDTAAKTGQSERAIQRDAERGEKISVNSRQAPFLPALPPCAGSSEASQAK